MKIVYLPKKEIDQKVANTIIDLVKKNPKCVLGLATGSSPLGTYANLVKAVNDKKVSFKDVTTFNLDEYVGLDENHPQSYRYFMNTNLFNLIDINKNNTHVPDGLINPSEDCSYYDKKIEKAGGIDLQLLGLGSDGHIAFNEPGTSFDSLTHITPLTETTIKDNARFFNSIKEVPTTAITMGLKSIMNARKIVLIATGKNKEEAIKKLMDGDISENLPCSILISHPDVTIYVDSDTIELK